MWMCAIASGAFPLTHKKRKKEKKKKKCKPFSVKGKKNDSY